LTNGSPRIWREPVWNSSPNWMINKDRSLNFISVNSSGFHWVKNDLVSLTALGVNPMLVPG
jgi:hypothetical protein